MGSATAVEAIKGFTCLVTTTLGDAQAQQLAGGEQAEAELSAEEALEALQRLTLPRREPPADPAEDTPGGGGQSGQGMDRFLAWLGP